MNETFGSTCVCSAVEMTSAAMVATLLRLVARSGPVMICVYGAAPGLKASRNDIECVDAAPWDGVARYRVCAHVIGRDEGRLVHICTPRVQSSSQPRISKTTPSGATLANEWSLKQAACVCHNCPIRTLEGRSDSGRFGRGAIGETCCSRCLMADDQLDDCLL